jgi:tRNA nucleotidyltransferase (CCA-adding enzyme)
MNIMFQKAIPLIEKIEVAGYEAYFVGGSVRDDLINRDISDVDIATSATPFEIKQLFTQTVDLGIEHGTIMVIFQGVPYEITTFRTESDYKDFRRPEAVKFVRSLQEDLKRRDFTINAIAMNRFGEIIDPFCGHKAILERKIQTVGNPEERFSEDALRILRALRFVSQLSFTLDPLCYEAIEKMGHLLTNIAVERKTSEFEKLLGGDNRINGIELLYQTNVFRYLPGLTPFEQKFKNMMQYPSRDLGIEEMWGLLLFCLELSPTEVESFLRHWKLPVKKIRTIKSLHHWTDYRLKNNWSDMAIYDAGKENLVKAQRLSNVLTGKETNDTVNECLDRFNRLPIQSRAELTITGTEIIDIVNRPAGPWIKEYLSEIETMIIAGKLENQLEKIREWVQDCNLK